MVKSYLKYEHSKTFALINSTTSNVVWTPDSNVAPASIPSTGGGRAVAAANEEVLCWDVKKGELLSRWRSSDCKAQVSAIAQSRADQDIFAVGYEDGSIRLWDSKIAAVIVSFNGHRSAVTGLAFDATGVRLASGSKDTDVIIWDLIAEVGQVRLRGHKDQITAVHFLNPTTESDEPTKNGQSDEADGLGLSSDLLLTTGKDALIKVWDIPSQHCIETHVAQSNGECWAMGVTPDASGCITAGNDGELKVWSIDAGERRRVSGHAGDQSEVKILRVRGTIYRQGRDRTLEVSFHPTADYFAVHGLEKSVEIWRIRSETEVQKSMARQRKRRREKSAKGASDGGGYVDEMVEALEDTRRPSASDYFVPYVVIRTGGKVRSMHWAGKRSKQSIQILVSDTNNQLELYKLTAKDTHKKNKSEGEPEYTRIFGVDMPGHRTDIRSLSLSSDDKMLASASSGSLKIWNARTQNCIRTFECGYALCCAFLPGDKIVVIGTKSGELELFDVTSAAMIDKIQAHEGSIWTLQVHPDGKSLVTGGAEKCAKFWNFEVSQEIIPGTRRTTPRLRLVHTRTLKVTDEILSLRISPDSRLLALALLDNTVKVFFVDSLKLFLNLYGHKLPVLNMDISFDSKMIVTCSADKNVRLWGLDFGDCHKALFAHQDSIMQVAFVPQNHDGNGHHFFSASKDRVIKYWDGDKFEQIQRLDGHHGEIWALAISHSGEFLVSAGHDKSIRIWEQTDEQIFLEEERERELEEMYESTLTTSLDKEAAEGEDGNEAAAAGKTTIDTLKAGEKIAEALELGIADLELMREWHAARESQPNVAPPPRNPLYLALGNISAERYVLNVLQRIKASALQDALLVLPFSTLPALFTFLNLFASQSQNIPLTCRILFFMLKTHHRQLVASKTMRPMLEKIRLNLRRALMQQKNQMGFNLAALRVVGERVRQTGVHDFVDEEAWNQSEVEDKGRKKRGFIDVA
ncbi:MAG: hypothetical protein M1825_001838 [Sarcosagium campestre]|nr:MAG: hypothetical protein M1825_001838 [Sarcosagium campestre]